MDRARRLVALGRYLLPAGPGHRTRRAGLDYDTDEGWRARAVAAGLELDHVRVSDDADWDAHLDGLTAAVSGWAKDEPDHSARARVESRLAAVRALFSPANRESLGFILYLFRKPV